jgi:hypothetical protein
MTNHPASLRVRVSQRKSVAPAPKPADTPSRDAVHERIENRIQYQALVREHLPVSDTPPVNRMCASGSRALDRLLGLIEGGARK